MQERERIGVGLLVMTVAAIPLLFFLVVVQSLILTGAALLVELGLISAVLVAQRRPPRPHQPFRPEPGRRPRR